MFLKQPSHKINEQLENNAYEDRELQIDEVNKNNVIESESSNHRGSKVTKSIDSYDYSDSGVKKSIDEILNTGQLPISDSKVFYNTKDNEINGHKCSKKEIEENMLVTHNSVQSAERVFALYEISNPDLWFTAELQLFEKLTTPEGKTVWNDLTKEEIASVSTTNREWSNEDLDIQYKPTEFVARQDFILPLKGLCLVVPVEDDQEFPFKGKSGEFIIVPADDIVTLDDAKEMGKRDENVSDFYAPSTKVTEQHVRKVIVRTARALMGGGAVNLKMLSRNSDRYLTLPHTKPHCAQIDLEARADDNELILVGVFGRLTTIVSDTTRKTRSILTVQATNTGLAAARFRVLTRECRPELSDNSIERDATTAPPVLLPPRHSQNFRLTLPVEILIESANCTVALVNEDDESVAVRDVKIKRDDRCFCVWHCDCVCLNEDPKLRCRDMTSAKILAAGLPTKQKFRHTRSVCYPDVISLNLFVIFIGVLLALLLLGIVKAFLGLVLHCVASWGLQLLLQMPRKLDRYYESSLRDRRVVYDNEGWPVHPDTKERNVRFVSKPLEFILNLIFFITLPCILIWEAIKKLASHCLGAERTCDVNYRKGENKKCFSSHDVQGMDSRYRRRRRGLRRWMTPHAEELTTGIWQEGLYPLGNKSCEFLRPLLREDGKMYAQSSCADSEQDDTEYVLMQMQKSRESLARSQRQLETATDTRNKWKDNINTEIKKQ